MTVPNWAELEMLFEQVRDLPEDQRDSVLEAPNVDDGLRAEVIALLRARDRGHRLSLERWIADETPPPTDEDDGWVDHQFGAWRVRSVLARGGMGVVYVAERADGQFSKKSPSRFSGAAFVIHMRSSAFGPSGNCSHR